MRFHAGPQMEWNGPECAANGSPISSNTPTLHTHIGAGARIRHQAEVSSRRAGVAPEYTAPERRRVARNLPGSGNEVENVSVGGGDSAIAAGAHGQRGTRAGLGEQNDTPLNR